MCWCSSSNFCYLGSSSSAIGASSAAFHAQGQVASLSGGKGGLHTPHVVFHLVLSQQILHTSRTSNGSHFELIPHVRVC